MTRRYARDAKGRFAAGGGSAQSAVAQKRSKKRAAGGDKVRSAAAQKRSEERAAARAQSRANITKLRIISLQDIARKRKADA